MYFIKLFLVFIYLIFDTSGGGVTLSGGEPLMNIPYVYELVKEIKRNNINILVETSGLFNYNQFEEFIYPFIDIVYMDIKFIDNELHKRYTGVSNEIILENFLKINKLFSNSGKMILARTPLIPGITDFEKNLNEIIIFLMENKIDKIGLLPYNPTWVPKLFKIGKDSPYKNEMWLDKEKIEECKKLFTNKGIDVV